MHTVNEAFFYPFGSSESDAQLGPPDRSSLITLSTPLQFFGAPESTLYVSQLYICQRNYANAKPPQIKAGLKPAKKRSLLTELMKFLFN